MIITKKEFDIILQKQEGEEFPLKVDFGLRTVKGEICGKKAVFEKKYFLNLSQKVKDKFCYMIKEDELVPVAFFSEETNRYYKLVPTRDWPTIAIGSVPMHSVTVSSPKEDTLRKIEMLSPYGVVLDTCMGMGYTAICASFQSKKVLTFERDENVLFLAKLNPLSQRLFTPSQDQNFSALPLTGSVSSVIEPRMEDITVAIKEFKPETFDCIIHDPPTFKLSPELYSIDFYCQLYRVIKKGGKLYHYLPRYKVRSGYDFPSKIKSKCARAVFSIVKFLPQEGNLLCAA